MTAPLGKEAGSAVVAAKPVPSNPKASRASGGQGGAV